MAEEKEVIETKTEEPAEVKAEENTTAFAESDVKEEVVFPSGDVPQDIEVFPHLFQPVDPVQVAAPPQAEIVDHPCGQVVQAVCAPGHLVFQHPGAVLKVSLRRFQGDLLLLMEGQQKQAQAGGLHREADQDQPPQLSREKTSDQALPLYCPEGDPGAEVFLQEGIEQQDG